MTHTTPSFSFVYEKQDEFQIEDLLKKDIYHLSDVKKGGCVVDIGANIGLFSLLCAADRGCDVVAVEPDKRNFDMLCANISKTDKIIPVQKAISNVNGMCSFRSRSDHSGGSHLDIYLKSDDPCIPGYFKEPAENHSGIFNITTVQCTTLKGLFIEHHIDMCDFMKIDCEGAEYFIFQEDNSDIFREKVHRVVFECHSEKDTSYITFLTDLGYEVKNNSYSIGSIIYAQNKGL